RIGGVERGEASRVDLPRRTPESIFVAAGEDDRCPLAAGAARDLVADAAAPPDHDHGLTEQLRVTGRDAGHRGLSHGSSLGCRLPRPVADDRRAGPPPGQPAVPSRARAARANVRTFAGRPAFAITGVAMPWFPDFVAAAEIARRQVRAAGDEDPVAQYLMAL